MFKKLIIAALAVVFVATPFCAALADGGPEGNKRKGKYTYRKVYKACAVSGGVASATPTISPADKKMVEWKDIFEGKKFDEFGCQDNWAGLSDKDVLDIYTYFYKHAADSPTPAKCQ